jgi:hypothetical protein
MLYGTAEAEPQADIVVAQLAQELYNSNLLLLLVQNLSRIDFEVRFVTIPIEILNMFQLHLQSSIFIIFRVRKMLLRYSIIY